MLKNFLTEYLRVPIVIHKLTQGIPMEDDRLGFVIVCTFCVVCFFTIVLLPIAILVYSRMSSREAEVPEQPPESIEAREAARRRLVEKGVVPEDRW